MTAAQARTNAREPRKPPATGGAGFASLVGQDPVVRALRHALSRNLLPHALIFQGPSGVGKASAAGLLAQALNCPVAGPADACGECVSCSKIARGIHPDLLWVFQHDRRKGIAIAQIVPRDPSRSTFRPDHDPVTQVVGLAPHEGRRRVVVIDDAHTMSAEAQNALLKTLEEPPPSTVLVLTTSAAGTLLPTVRSRCQSLTFRPVPRPDLIELLENRYGLESGEARLRAALSPGSIGGALAVDLDAYGTMLEEVATALREAQAGMTGVIRAADSLASMGDGTTAIQKASDTLGVLRNVLRDLLLVATGADEARLVHPDRIETWEAWVAELDAGGIAAALAAVNDGIDRFSGIPPSAKMAIERTLIDVHRALAGSSAGAGDAR